MSSLFVSQLKNVFKNRNRLDLSDQLETFACVAILIYQSAEQELEIGFIKRAQDPNDRWSGQIAFPGGKKDPQDISDLMACFREVKEEIGLQLTSQELIGVLNDIQARKAGGLLPFFIRPFVFLVQHKSPLYLDPREVADFFWVPWSYLISPTHHSSYTALHKGQNIQLPAILLPNQEILWGLTHLMVMDLKSILNPVV